MLRASNDLSLPGLKPADSAGAPSRVLPDHPHAVPRTRREFLVAGAGSLLLTALRPWPPAGAEKDVVSIVRIGRGGIPRAVEEALDLLGGVGQITAGRQRIMLKPNLVAESPRITTKREVIRTLATLMQAAGKDVSIGEGSAAGDGFNLINGVQYRTNQREILDPMQQYVFDQLGYTDLARNLRVPLVNLHSGELTEVSVPGGYVFDRITLNRTLTDVDMLVSVPMMKTHVLATVTLGMKNLIGLYPGTVYYSVRAWLHEHAFQGHSPGVAYEIVDMVRANKLGLTVIDASTAMEGDGPSDGELVDMGLIIAGTNPLATDMVGSSVMGIAPREVPTFAAAWNAGMLPTALADIEIRGLALAQALRPFRRPNVVSWSAISGVWANQELRDAPAPR